MGVCSKGFLLLDVRAFREGHLPLIAVSVTTNDKRSCKLGQKKGISKFMLAFGATPWLVQQGRVGPADHDTNMRTVCDEDISE